eukprot:1694036-Pyramimonas_sp.AAC.1
MEEDEGERENIKNGSRGRLTGSVAALFVRVGGFEGVLGPGRAALQHFLTSFTWATGACSDAHA